MQKLKNQEKFRRSLSSGFIAEKKGGKKLNSISTSAYTNAMVFGTRKTLFCIMQKKRIWFLQETTVNVPKGTTVYIADCKRGKNKVKPMGMRGENWIASMFSSGSMEKSWKRHYSKLF